MRPEYTSLFKIGTREERSSLLLLPLEGGVRQNASKRHLLVKKKIEKNFDRLKMCRSLRIELITKASLSQHLLKPLSLQKLKVLVFKWVESIWGSFYNNINNGRRVFG